MVNQTRTGKQHRTNDPKPCCSADCADDSCALVCMERPQFFYGQVLNDQDLNAVVDYTRQRLALRRFYEGWGVVSGLQAYLTAQPMTVVVRPGSALDCCGNDIVLCEPLYVDLSGVLPDTGKCLTAEAEKYLVSINTLAIDLYITHRETLTDPRTSLTRCSSAELQCEYSRLREGGSIRLECRINPPTVPDEHVSDDWYDALVRVIKPVRNKAEEFINGSNQAWDTFTTWLASQPAGEFNLRRLFEMDKSEPTVTKILSLMLIERVNEFFYTQCAAPGDCDGVRIARVWLHKNSSGFEISFIDNQPPMRQVLRHSCLPVLRGRINIAPVLWRPIDEARPWLADRGIYANENAQSLPQSFKALIVAIEGMAAKKEDLETRLFASPPKFELFTVDALGLLPETMTGRVVLFNFSAVGTIDRPAPAPAPERPRPKNPKKSPRQ